MSSINNTVTIGVTGGTCSGKGKAVDNFVEIIGKENVTVLYQDSYYKSLPPDTDPGEYDFDHPDAIDWNLLVTHLKMLLCGDSIDSPVYDFTTHGRLEKTVRMNPTKVIILEGILIFTQKAILDLLQLKLYIDADHDKRLMRRIRRDTVERGRDIESVVNQYEKTVKIAHEKFIEPCKKLADFIILNNEDNEFTGISKLSFLVRPLLF